jgi:hypothetical protein
LSEVNVNRIEVFVLVYSADISVDEEESLLAHPILDCLRIYD